MQAEGQASATALSGADRVLAALKRLAAASKGIGLEELARELGAPKSSTHRALAILRRAGFAVQDGQSRYHLGLEFVRLAFHHYESLDEPALVRPALGALAERFGETAHYAKLDGAEIVYLAKVTPPGQGVHMSSVVGGRNPAHCTGLGKALLAHALPDQAEVERFVAANGPLAPRTPRTLVGAADLHRDLQRVRARGYALDREESETGINCIGFPVFLGPASSPSGAISIAALAQRTPVRMLAAAGDEIRAILATHLGTDVTSGAGRR